MAVINGTPGDDFLTGTSGNDQINGFGGNDNLVGQAGDDQIDGGEGHDLMRGRAGNDILLGGNGDDFLNGGEDDDLIDGGAGFDRAVYSFEAITGVTIDLNLQGVAQNTGQGFDTLIGIEHVSGTRFDDVITGDGGDNWLWGGSDGSGVTGNDVISAGGGNDLVEVGTGNHNLDGGSGVDSLSLWGNSTDIGPAGVTVSLLLQGAAQDSEQGMMLLVGFENLSGSEYADSLTGDGGVNVLAGDLGDDLLVGGAGNDTLYGDGRIIIDSHGAATSGPITTYSDVATAFGLASGDDVLDGGEGDDILDGGGGADTASYASSSGAVMVALGASGGSSSGAAGNDSLISIEDVLGSAHDDTISGNNAINTLHGGGGHDLIFGNDGDDVIDGGTGHDALRGGVGNDSLAGGDGDDFLNGGTGDDVINGGSGLDRAAYSTGATAGVTVDLNIIGVAQDTGQGFDILSGIEHASGTRFNDVITGDGGDNWLWGGSDGSGATGNDIISAGAGNDLVQAGAGNHSLDGGVGVDTLSLHGNGTDISAAGVTVSLALQGIAQDSEQGLMTLTGFENLSGSTLDDTLSGDGGDNLLAGDLGNDTLRGDGGDDVLLGDGAVRADTHNGGSGPIVTDRDVAAVFGEPGGNDSLDGGKGNDVLIGGGGDDLLTGGHGDDLFLFGPGSGDDRITDMSKKDVIAIVGVAGVDDFSDLTIATDGSGNAVISWGSDDSVTLVGLKPKQVSASMFTFDDPTVASAAAPLTMLVPGESFG